MQQQQNEKLQGLVDSQLKQPVAAPVVEAAPTAVVARVETTTTDDSNVTGLKKKAPPAGKPVSLFDPPEKHPGYIPPDKYGNVVSMPPGIAPATVAHSPAPVFVASREDGRPVKVSAPLESIKLEHPVAFAEASGSKGPAEFHDAHSIPDTPTEVYPSPTSRTQVSQDRQPIGHLHTQLEDPLKDRLRQDPMIQMDPGDLGFQEDLAADLVGGVGEDTHCLVMEWAEVVVAVGHLTAEMMGGIQMTVKGSS